VAAIAQIIAGSRVHDAHIPALGRSCAEAGGSRRGRHGIGMAVQPNDTAAPCKAIEQMVGDAARQCPIVRTMDARGCGHEFASIERPLAGAACARPIRL
jgi:hypothetical protein